MLLYRVERTPHVSGFVLAAGHWGDGFTRYTIARCQTDFWAPWRVASEAIIERVRAIEFPQRPSRLRCSFSWPDEASARVALAQSPGWCIEILEPIDPLANQFVADFALLSSGSRFQLHAPFLLDNERIARQYWTGGQAVAPELLIESDLRVVGVLP
ncbi:hypothetical protein [Variovorax sp. OV329]|uniref:hypothetical protein n=1 Tax=Variovorax sp. OV329 TaxID=1882825 RepID=UPI000B84B344|nr:hypothetical protein [Variovorax sp. OV329]